MTEDTVVTWLLVEDNPSVRALALMNLCGKHPDDSDVRRAKRSVMEKGLGPLILAQQNSDGSWGVPERFYRDKYMGTTWTLLILAELGANPADPRIKNGCEFILNRSQEPEGGGFSYESSKVKGYGLSSGVVPCLTGNMVYSLIRLGYLEDPRVQKAIAWIIRYQRTDDGADAAPTGGVYDRYEMCWGTHSCHMGVAKSLKALAAIPRQMRSREVEQKIDELIEYFLIHHIYKKSHDLKQIARPGWLKFGFPLMYQTDVLEIMEILTDLGVKDPRMRDALAVIRKAQIEDGRWRLQSSFNGKTVVEIEQKSQPSKWLTYKALKVLQANHDDIFTL